MSDKKTYTQKDLDDLLAGGDAEIAALDAKIAPLDAKIAALDAKIAALDAKIAALEAEIAKAHAENAIRYWTAYFARERMSFLTGRCIPYREGFQKPF